MRPVTLYISLAAFALASCSQDKEEKQDKIADVDEQAQSYPPPVLPTLGPEKTQRATCTGVDGLDRPQTLVLESRWVPADSRTTLFVVEDSTGLLKAGDWLENQSSPFGDGDRKYGISLGWEGDGFSKRVGNRYVRIMMQEHGIASASIVYLTRPYTEREKTAERGSILGSISLTGHCRLFVENQVRSLENKPRPEPVP